MRYILKCIILSGILFSFCSLQAQIYEPGQVYFDSTGFVEYRAGNLPLIFSAPHGGNLDPDSIPDRKCNDCVLVNDAWTKPITEGVYDRIVEWTGCYPHVIINLLRRSKFDANRDIDEAAVGNPLIEQSWRGYHTFIEAAKTEVVGSFSRGLFLDMHGHGHTIQRIELGYLLSRSELQLSDSILNTSQLLQESSIRTLTTDNIQSLSHAELIRGEMSMGTLLMDKGFPTVPSAIDPFPQGSDSYFSGGYNTVRHGSRDQQDQIDAIQIEMNQDIRFDESRRLALIDSLAMVALEYYGLHYNDTFEDELCNVISSISNRDKNKPIIQIYPNPAKDYFVIESEIEIIKIDVYNALGQKMTTSEVSNAGLVSVSSFESGLYIIRFLGVEGSLSTKILVVN